MKAHPLLLSWSARHGPARAWLQRSEPEKKSSKRRRRTTEHITDPRGGSSLTLRFSPTRGLRWINGRAGRRERGWNGRGGEAMRSRPGAGLLGPFPEMKATRPLLVPAPTPPGHFWASRRWIARFHRVPGRHRNCCMCTLACRVRVPFQAVVMSWKPCLRCCACALRFHCGATPGPSRLPVEGWTLANRTKCVPAGRHLRKPTPRSSYGIRFSHLRSARADPSAVATGQQPHHRCGIHAGQ